MAFQIKDDLLDYQKKGSIGKPTGNDLKEKKFTLPLIYALENCSKNDRSRIIKTIRRHNNNNQKIREVMDFVIQNNGLEFARGKMIEFRDEAVAFLDDFPQNPAKEALIRLVDYSVNRSK